ncbi:MAG: FimB/Mfa2 family fimbrial subunit [Prevotellaceae bacterium]|nr:FimB/Mfa2 family fimbrial subunit [Prevotellaceae bacterium]
MKKHISIIMLAAGLLLASCSDKDTLSSPSEGEATITFSVSNYEQVDLDDVETRSTEVSNLKLLFLAVYDAQTLEPAMDVIKQSSDDEGYGSFSVTLPYGQYKLVFLGCNNDAEVDMSDPEAITFGNGYVPQTFLKTLDLAVDGETSTSQTISLSRVVGAFKVVCSGLSEYDPQTFTFNFTLKGSGSTLNALTGLAPQAGERTYSFTSDLHEGVLRLGFTMYLLLPTADDTTIDCSVTFSGEDGTLSASRTFTDVPVRINKLTTYTGDFFSAEGSKASFTIELADDYDEWSETEDYTF